MDELLMRAAGENLQNPNLKRKANNIEILNQDESTKPSLQRVGSSSSQPPTEPQLLPAPVTDDSTVQAAQAQSYSQAQVAAMTNAAMQNPAVQDYVWTSTGLQPSSMSQAAALQQTPAVSAPAQAPVKAPAPAPAQDPIAYTDPITGLVSQTLPVEPPKPQYTGPWPEYGAYVKVFYRDTDEPDSGGDWYYGRVTDIRQTDGVVMVLFDNGEFYEEEFSGENPDDFQIIDKEKYDEEKEARSPEAKAAEIARKKNWQKPYGPYEWADYNNAVLVRNSSYARKKMELKLGDQHDIIELDMSSVFDPKYWKVTAYRNKRKQGLWTVFKFFVREQWHKPLGLRTALKVRRDILSGVYLPVAR